MRTMPPPDAPCGRQRHKKRSERRDLFMKELKTISNLLFTPGNRPERFEKAKEVGTDGIIIDLEDAIALPDTDAARATVIEYFQYSTP